MEELQLLEKAVLRQQKQYYGKYRAFVVDNADPEARGRVRLSIPSVLGSETSEWALPCLPYGGAAGFGFVAVPPKQAQVFAEFVEGDVSSPVWTGTFWRSAEEVPDDVGGTAPSLKMLKTESGHALVMEDEKDKEEIRLRSKAEASMVLAPNGSLTLTDSAGATLTLDAEGSEVKVADANGNEIVLTASGVNVKDANGNEITTAAAGVTVKGSKVTVEANQVALAGNGGEPLMKGQSFMALFNAHVHPCTAPGSPSGPPATPMTPGQLSMKTTTT